MIPCLTNVTVYIIAVNDNNAFIIINVQQELQFIHLQITTVHKASLGIGDSL